MIIEEDSRLSLLGNSINEIFIIGNFFYFK